MTQVRLPDGSTRELWAGATAADLAAAIGPGLAKAAVAAKVNGEIVDLSRPLPDGADAGNLVIAYEPVWAIGTGLTPTPDDVAEVHGFIRERLVARFVTEGQATRILYGGSVDEMNAGAMLKGGDVHGLLVGRASEDGARLESLLQTIEKA